MALFTVPTSCTNMWWCQAPSRRVGGNLLGSVMVAAAHSQVDCLHHGHALLLPSHCCWWCSWGLLAGKLPSGPFGPSTGRRLTAVRCQKRNHPSTHQLTSTTRRHRQHPSSLPTLTQLHKVTVTTGISFTLQISPPHIGVHLGSDLKASSCDSACTSGLCTLITHETPQNFGYLQYLNTLDAFLDYFLGSRDL